MRVIAQRRTLQPIIQSLLRGVNKPPEYSNQIRVNIYCRRMMSLLGFHRLSRWAGHNCPNTRGLDRVENVSYMVRAAARWGHYVVEAQEITHEQRSVWAYALNSSSRAGTRLVAKPFQQFQPPAVTLLQKARYSRLYCPECKFVQYGASFTVLGVMRGAESLELRYRFVG